MIEVRPRNMASVDKTEGKGKGVVEISVKPNPMREDRFSKGYVRVGDEKHEFKMIQLSKSSLLPIPKSDYIVLRYLWEESDGDDFDTATCFKNTYVRELDGKFVGWSKLGKTTVSNVENCIIHGGDNLNHGKESVLIDMNRASKKVDNNEYTINALVYGNWYGERKSGNVTVEVSAYIGGYMEKDGFDFVNVEGKIVFKDSVKINVRNSGENNYLNIKQLYKKIAEVVYNKKDKDCVIFLLPEY